MIYRIAQFLAFGAVIAAFIFSGATKNNNRKIEPDSFDNFIKENIATSSVKKFTDILPVSLIPEPGKKEETKIPVSAEKKILEESEKISAVPVLNSAPAQENTENQYPAISSDDFLEKSINLQSIALIKCAFQSQYYDSSSQPWGEQRFNLGTGIVISPKGLILTARHLFEVSEDLLNDPAGRIWSRKKCEVALTDRDVLPISALTTAGKTIDERFKDAEIIFMASDADYIGARGIDLAVLKIKTDGEISGTALFPYLMEFREKEPIILIGYPGRESLVSQQLERFDGQFVAITYYKESLCGVGGKPCGLRYILRRYPADYEKDFWKKTDLGVVTPYFRGGFSGAPAFYKGNLIGIATHGVSGSDADDGWDQAVILTSWDIFEFLKEHDITL